MDQVFLKQNEGWNAEPNAPYPKVEVKGSSLELEFLANPYRFKEYSDGEKIVLTFDNCLRYRLGSTNDEGWYRGQCRFSKLAPEWGEFYEIKGATWDDKLSDWIDVGKNVGQQPRHFLFYFRDETFECKASNWSMQRIKGN